MNKIIVLLALVSSSALSAYKCKIDGRTIYQDAPCPNAEKIAIQRPAEGSLDNRFHHQIMMHKISIGMSKRHVRLSWGEPDDINRSGYSGMVREQWVYKRGRHQMQFIHFENGIVTSWSES